MSILDYNFQFCCLFNFACYNFMKTISRSHQSIYGRAHNEALSNDFLNYKISPP